MSADSDDLLPLARGYRHERDRIRERDSASYWLIFAAVAMILGAFVALDGHRIVAYIIGGD